MPPSAPPARMAAEPPEHEQSGGSGPSMLVISIGAVLIGLVAVAALIVFSGGLGGDDERRGQRARRPAAGRRSCGRDAPSASPMYAAGHHRGLRGSAVPRLRPVHRAHRAADHRRTRHDGTVSFTYNDFAFLGDESWDAAIAMRVAEAMDGKFWDYQQVLFHNQSGENQGAFSRSDWPTWPWRSASTGTSSSPDGGPHLSRGRGGRTQPGGEPRRQQHAHHLRQRRASSAACPSGKSSMPSRRAAAEATGRLSQARVEPSVNARRARLGREDAPTDPLVVASVCSRRRSSAPRLPRPSRCRDRAPPWSRDATSAMPSDRASTSASRMAGSSARRRRAHLHAGANRPTRHGPLVHALRRRRLPRLVRLHLPDRRSSRASGAWLRSSVATRTSTPVRRQPSRSMATPVSGSMSAYPPTPNARCPSCSSGRCPSARAVSSSRSPTSSRASSSSTSTATSSSSPSSRSRASPSVDCSRPRWSWSTSMRIEPGEYVPPEPTGQPAAKPGRCGGSRASQSHPPAAPDRES